MSRQPNRAEVRHSWPTKRRDWRDHLNLSKRIVRSTESLVNLIARRSNDSGKPVWGSQANMAEELGVSTRTVMRGLAELERAGYLKVYRSKPERGPNGRFCRRRSNCYYLVIPGREKASQPAPRRRQRVPYCVVPADDGRHHLGDSDATSSPDGVSQPRHHPPRECQSESSAYPKTRIPPGRVLLDDTPEGVTTTGEVYRQPESGSRASYLEELRRQHGLRPKPTKPTSQP